MSYGVAPTADTVRPDMPTFMDHFRELQGRLFSVALTFILVAAAAYPFFDTITAILTAPLKDNQQLVYLTPGGAFSFIIKVCIYIGIIGSLPVIIYHIYRFVMPAVRPVHLKTVLKYTVSSMLLAICGIVFAYFVSLPASLYFLTSFNLHNIQAMLTVDSYFSFVMTYLLAGAVLFQLPLIMLIVNSVSPLTPTKLMRYQRHMIVGSFVIAAVISPTPDAMNQILLAAPVVVMYQLGIIMIWWKNRKAVKADDARFAQKVSLMGSGYGNAKPRTSLGVEDETYLKDLLEGGEAVDRPRVSSRPAPVRASAARQTVQVQTVQPQSRRSIDGMGVRKNKLPSLSPTAISDIGRPAPGSSPPRVPQAAVSKPAAVHGQVRQTGQLAFTAPPKAPSHHSYAPVVAATPKQLPDAVDAARLSPVRTSTRRAAQPVRRLSVVRHRQPSLAPFRIPPRNMLGDIESMTVPGRVSL